MKEANCFIAYEPMVSLVRLTIIGSVDPGRLWEICGKGIEEGRNKGCHCFLVDHREAPFVNSMAGTYDFMSSLNELGLTRKDKIAVIYKTDTEKHRFAENVAQNRGWYNLHYFSTLKEGEGWLMKAAGILVEA